MELGALGSTLVSLLLVCVLAVGALRALGPRSGAAGGLQLLAQLPLAGRRTLYVVGAGSRAFLVGVGDGPMTMLAELGPEEVRALAARPDGARVASDENGGVAPGGS